MAPFWRLALEIRRAGESENPERTLLTLCDAVEATVLTAAPRIARQFGKALAAGRRAEVVTYSYSSTVLRAILHARASIARVYCSECRPELEGRKMARLLARAGVPVTFVADACLPMYVASPADRKRRLIVATGADAVLPDCYLNRTGTGALLACAHEHGVPFWILTDTLKFAPAGFPHGADGYEPWRNRVWPGHPRNVEVRNVILSAVPYRPGIRFLTERGPMRLPRVRAEIRRLASAISRTD